MYRTVARRLLGGANSFSNINRQTLRLPHLESVVTRSCTSVNTPPSSNDRIHRPLPVDRVTLNQSDSTSSSSSSSSGDQEAPRYERREYRAGYQEEQARVLQASLGHVMRLGWTEAAMIAGAREIGVSPSVVGSFPRKEAALVEFFMDECLQKLIDRIDAEEELHKLTSGQRVAKLVRIRLEMQAPYISKWPQALSIQAHPLNASTSFKQRAVLIDEICHAAGDEASDIDWYVKRTILGGIYSTTEIYMLTDSSPEFRNTWDFLDARVKDAFDLRKTIQEATYLAEAVGAGIGGSLQGLMGKVFQR